MKKFMKYFMIACLTFVLSFTFYGCDNDDKFYEKTSIEFESFITNVCENNDYNQGIKYGENIKAIIEKIENEPGYVTKENKDKLTAYTQIPNVYDKIFVSSFRFLSSFSNVLINKPTDTSGNVKNSYNNLTNKLKSTTKNIQNFSQKALLLDNQFSKKDYESSEMIKDIYIQVLKEYKRDYIDITNQVIDICENFQYICENYIFTKITTYVEDNKYIELSPIELVNQRNLALLKSSISTLKSAILYLDGFNGEYRLMENDKFVDTLKLYISMDLTKSENVTVPKMQVWLNNYNAFLGEKENFDKSLNGIDFDKLGRLYNFDYDKYVNDFPTHKPYIDNIKNFASESITSLYNVSLNLC